MATASKKKQTKSARSNSNAKSSAPASETVASKPTSKRSKAKAVASKAAPKATRATKGKAKVTNAKAKAPRKKEPAKSNSKANVSKKKSDAPSLIVPLNQNEVAKATKKIADRKAKLRKQYDNSRKRIAAELKRKEAEAKLKAEREARAKKLAASAKPVKRGGGRPKGKAKEKQDENVLVVERKRKTRPSSAKRKSETPELDQTRIDGYDGDVQSETYMCDSQLDFFREIVNQRLGELAKDAQATLDETRAPIAQPDELDRATDEQTIDIEWKKRERERNLVNKLKVALTHMDSGEYGYCNDCGNQIGLPRLRARPHASKCFDCESMHDMDQGSP